MNRLASLIRAMDYDDLKAIQRDLAEGNIGSLIKARLQQFEVRSEKSCPTCGTQVDEAKDYVLSFGPPDFRKRAVFCGLDCLTAFVKKLTYQKTTNSQRNL